MLKAEAFSAFAVCVVLLGVSCRRTPASDPAVLTAATARVSRYVEADTLGRWRAADSLVDWTACDFDPATDGLLPTVAVTIGTPVQHNDTVDVPVLYSVLGVLSSLDSRTAGTMNFRFEGQRRTDTTVFHVVYKAKDRSRIVCGEYRANHVGLSAISGGLGHLDSASRSAFEQSLREAHGPR
jgi:hypothetical protein